jgi:hypothetical protein
MATISPRSGPDAASAIQERVAWARLPVAAVAAAAGAAAASALLFALESAVGVIDHSVAVPSLAGIGPVSFASVTTSAAVGSLGAAAAFAVVGAIASRPIRVFQLVSVVALVLSLAMPLTVPGPSPVMRVGLALMHVLTWAIAVAVLTTMGRR